MNNLISQIEKDYMKKEIPAFNVGDVVKVMVKVIEGEKERLQAFEGIVIAKKGGGIRETFTVRRVSFGIGIERVFPIHSPRVDKVEVIRKGKVRRAKLYYLRQLSGKAAKIKESKDSIVGKRKLKLQEPQIVASEQPIVGKETKIKKSTAKAKN